METIYYGHVPPARDRRPSEGRPEVVLKATRGVRNNIPYTYAVLCKLYLRLLPKLKEKERGGLSRL